jgi:type IV pilus assembly protein PilM
MGSTRVVGLDIGTTAVRAAELEFGGGGPSGTAPATLHRLGQVPLPPGAVRDGEVVQKEVVSSALRHLWAQQKFSTRDVVIGVGNQHVLVRELDLPWAPPAHLKESLAFQVQELLPMSTDDAYLDYFATQEFDGPNGRTVQGMLVAAQRDTVDANVAAVEGAGLQTRMVDLNAFALLRAVARGDLAQRTVALVDMGASVTTIVISVHGVPRLVRTLPSGGQNITNSVATSLRIETDEAEAVKREIGVGYAVSPDRAPAAEAILEVTRTLVESVRNTFVYYSGNNPGAGIDVVLLTGGGSSLPGLGQYLSSASRVSVALGDPLAGLLMAKTVDRAALNGFGSLVALPVGLGFGVAA